MGMCKVNGPDALPVKPAGLENLGKGTNNICEAFALYGMAKPDDYGQRMPTRIDRADPGARHEVMFGQGTQVDPDTLHYVRHCEKFDARSRTCAEEAARRERVIARRKLKKASKKLCKQLGIKYQ